MSGPRFFASWEAWTAVSGEEIAAVTLGADDGRPGLWQLGEAGMRVDADDAALASTTGPLTLPTSLSPNILRSGFLEYHSTPPESKTCLTRKRLDPGAGLRWH